MFKKLTILSFLVGSLNISMAQINDDFNDGSFTTGTVWTESTAGDFKDTLGMLRSNNNIASSTYFITTPNTTAINCQWEFFINLKFSTSSANYVDVYLTADNSNLLSPTLNGYFVRIGNTSDEISLYKNNAGTSVELIDGLDAVVSSSSNNLIKIKVTRDAAGQFTLQRDMTGTGTSFTTEGTVTDNDFTTSVFFGFLIKQSTASFFKKHFIDDVYVGPIIVDTDAPLLVSANPLSSFTLDVLFNEPLDPSSAQTSSNYTVNNSIGVSASAVLDGSNPSLVHLTFATPFSNLVNYELVVNNVSDVLLNAVNNDTIAFTYFISDTAVAGDVIINEILADETPQVGLPAAEFIELYNRSAKYFDLNGWTFSDGGTTPATFTSYILGPGEYVIVCAHSDTTDYLLFGNTKGVSNFPGLTNAGESLTLKNNAGTLINTVTYTDNWYGDPLKDDGGYTLELINPDAPLTCPAENNWHASNHFNGGTPGLQNSIYSNIPDTVAPVLSDYTLISPTQIDLIFSEAIDTTSLIIFSVAGGTSVSSYDFIPSDLTRIHIVFSSPLMPKTLYTIAAIGVADCVGNTQGSTINFLLPTNEIIINELLFDPSTGVSDFIELYNNAPYSIDLKNWSIANIENDTIDNAKLIAQNSLVLNAGEYLVFTTDKTALTNYYSQAIGDRIVEVASLPSFDNDSSTAILITSLNTVSDRFSYSDEMHFQLLKSFEGVSLERMDFNRSTNDAGNWHSAAEQAGYATPGYLNSQFMSNEITESEFSLGNELFSPDNDGYQDVINFNYKFSEPGYVANATVYDAKGRSIKRLVKNELLAIEGTFTWDGLNEKTEKAELGIYIIYFEYFNLAGEVKKVKKSFVLAGKF